jgi:Cu/Ag efflux protein CusF
MKARTIPVFIAIFFIISASAIAQMNHGGMQGGSTQGGSMQGGSTQGGGVQGGSTQGGGMQGGSMQGGAAAMTTQHGADSAMGEGQVKKVDKAKGTVTLAHGAMNGMPAMTMAYKVKDTAWLDKLQAGQKIRFATDPADGGMTVTRFELVK